MAKQKDRRVVVTEANPKKGNKKRAAGKKKMLSAKNQLSQQAPFLLSTLGKRLNQRLNTKGAKKKIEHDLMDNTLSKIKKHTKEKRTQNPSKTVKDRTEGSSLNHPIVLSDSSDEEIKTTSPKKSKSMSTLEKFLALGEPETVVNNNQKKQKKEEKEPLFIPFAEDDKQEKRPEKRSRVSSVHASGTAKGWAHAPWQEMPYSKNPGVALHQEIVDFVKFVKPTEGEVLMRKEIIERIERVVYDLWPNAEVLLFGSVKAKIYLPTSDIDLVIMGDWKVLPLQTLASALKKANIPSKIQVIAKARVPIIKFRDSISSIDVDISFNMENGPAEASRIKRYLDALPGLRELTLVIKQFLAQRSMNEVRLRHALGFSSFFVFLLQVYTGGLGSYATILMVMNFLQMHPVKMKQKCNLGILLIEFFELYGVNFNYENTVVSTRDGGKYFYKSDEWFTEQRPWLLAIQNPRSDDDVCRNSYAMDSIRKSFEHAFYVLSAPFQDVRGQTSRNHKTLLSRIIKLPQEVVEYREWVKQNWEHKEEISE
eukprot:m.94518 g.94518  ORF g.94518 m.94518 type:complete len:538 (+) comp13449_c0_seq2:171-1784(+)